MSRKICKIIVCAVLSSLPLYAKVSFGGLDLNSENTLLFSVRHEVPGTPVYQSLFSAQLTKNSVKESPSLLTCYPEQMELINGGSSVQIRNRYGTALYSFQNDSLVWKLKADGIPVEYSRTAPMSVSPDGQWLCYVQKSSGARGKLVIQNVASGRTAVLCENCAMSYSGVSVKWAPDSKALLYEKDGFVYFETPATVFSTVQLSDALHRIGPGTINSVQWTSQGNLAYLVDDIIYKIQETELYTRGLYAALIGNGSLVGRLTSDFNSERDRFWLDKSGTQLVVIKDDNLVTWYSVKQGGYGYVTMNGSYPLTEREGSPLDYEIFWTQDKKPVLWLDYLKFKTGRKCSAAL